MPMQELHDELAADDPSPKNVCIALLDLANELLSEHRRHFGETGTWTNRLTDMCEAAALHGRMCLRRAKGQWLYTGWVLHGADVRSCPECALSDAQALERLAEFLLDEVRNLNAPNNIVAALSTHLGPASCTTVGRLRCIAGPGDSNSRHLV